MLDYHVHLWPHNESAEPAELTIDRLSSYCNRALVNGVTEIALTEHLFRFTAFSEIVQDAVRDNSIGALSDEMSVYFKHHMTADLDSYVEACLAARSAGLPIVLGLEVDYYPGKMHLVTELLRGYPFDVLVGSVHWLGPWLFDNLDEEPSRGEWDKRDEKEVWLAYTEALEEMAETKACDVLAHPDLVKILGRYPDRGFVKDCHSRIAEAAARSSLCAEISSAGWRKPVGEVYPAPELLRKFFLNGVPVTTASDAHGEMLVADRVTELREVARSAGYGSLRAFRRRTGRDVPFGVGDDTSSDTSPVDDHE